MKYLIKLDRLHIIVLTFVLILSACDRSFYRNSLPGPIKVEIMAIAEADSSVRTSNGDKFGKIGPDGNIYDLSGKLIGERKPSKKEVTKAINKTKFGGEW